MQLLSLFRTADSTQPPTRAAITATAAHALLLLALVGTFHRSPHLAPLQMPGTTQGVALLTDYSAGSPAHATGALSTKQPEQKPSTSAQALTAPATPNKTSAPTDLGTGNSTDSGLGQGEINLALQKYFPYPRPDLSTLPHGFSGDVVLNATVDADGKISNLTLLKGLGPTIDNTVIATVKNWSYTPATRNGVPVPSEQELHFHYERS
jgi:protein TonB